MYKIKDLDGFKLLVHDWGLINYVESWEKQTQIQQELIQKRRTNPNDEIVHHLIFCEHPHVYTIGKGGSESNLLIDEGKLAEIGATYYKINRGGDITYHGPGQIVGYLIFDLNEIGTDVHRFVRNIEEVIIRTLSNWNILGERHQGFTGVWLDQNDVFPARKICAIGIHLSRWISMHGFALNVNPNLQYFNHIIPCGINESGRMVTSMKVETGELIDLELVKEGLLFNFKSIFKFNNEVEQC